MSLWPIGYPTLSLSPHLNKQTKKNKGGGGKGTGGFCSTILQNPLRVLGNGMTETLILSNSDFSSVVSAHM